MTSRPWGDERFTGAVAKPECWKLWEGKVVIETA
jgi:hypothetical protein